MNAPSQVRSYRCSDGSLHQSEAEAVCTEYRVSLLRLIRSKMGQANSLTDHQIVGLIRSCAADIGLITSEYNKKMKQIEKRLERIKNKQLVVAPSETISLIVQS